METGNNVSNEALVQSTRKDVAQGLIKNQTKLRMSVRLRPDGISFLLVSFESRSILYFANYSIPSSPLTTTLIEKCLAQENEFLQKAERITWSWSGNTFSLVPEPLFEPSISSIYLDFQKNIDENDIHKIDTLTFIQAKLLFAIPKKFHQIMVRFATGDFNHTLTFVLSHWLKKQKPGVSEVLLLIEKNNFFVALGSNQDLILVNQFEYTAPEDLAYHLLFCMEQYHFNPERIPVLISGLIEENDPLHKILCKFIRNVEFIEPLGGFEMNLSIEGDHLFHATYSNLCALL